MGLLASWSEATSSARPSSMGSPCGWDASSAEAVSSSTVGAGASFWSSTEPAGFSPPDAETPHRRNPRRLAWCPPAARPREPAHRPRRQSPRWVPARRPSRASRLRRRPGLDVPSSYDPFQSSRGGIHGPATWKIILALLHRLWQRARSGKKRKGHAHRGFFR